jgi:hypothetical protein
MAAALIDSNVPQLKLLSKGKVRDIYATSSPEHLLFVASDRISAYDVILKNVKYIAIITFLPYLLLPLDLLTITPASQGHPGQRPRPHGALALLVRQAESHRSEPRRRFSRRGDARGGAPAQRAARRPLHPREEGRGHTARGDRAGVHHG